MEDANVDFVLIAARHALGLIESWEVPGIADAALGAGTYSGALAELATLRSPTMADVSPLLERAFRELGTPIPSKDAAAWIILRHSIGQLAIGKTQGRAALQPIIDVCNHAGLAERTIHYLGDSHGIDPFIGAYWEYDETDDTKGLDARVTGAARNWLRAHSVEPEDAQVIAPHDSPVRSMLAEARGDKYEAFASLAEAREHRDAAMIMEADSGGQILMTCPVSRIAAEESVLVQLLCDLEMITWGGGGLSESDVPFEASMHYERLPPGSGVAGGMGGGVVVDGVWVHEALVTLGLRQQIEDVIAGIRARLSA